MDNLDTLLNELHQTNVELLKRNQNNGAFNDYVPMSSERLLETEIDPVPSPPSTSPSSYSKSSFVVERNPKVELMPRRNLQELNDMLNSLDQSEYSNLTSDSGTELKECGNNASPSRTKREKRSNVNSFFVESIHDRRQDTRTAAVRAAEQLDELLLSLGQFKEMNEPTEKTRFQSSPIPNGDTSVASPQLPPRLYRRNADRAFNPVQKNSSSEPTEVLANMMSALSQELAEKGAITTAKGFCVKCEKPIVGMLISAMGKEWHPDHFTCANCGIGLVRTDFYERENQPYCVECHTNLFSPKCGHCDEAIENKCIVALNRAWHPEHFFCYNCHQRFFNNITVHEHDDKVYCSRCYLELFGARCAGCNLPIRDAYITALDNSWHRDCFVCFDCKRQLAGSNFLEVDGTPYCESHYYTRRGLVCNVCGEAITGRCVNALGRRYHPEHFQCAYCLHPLQTGTFKEHSQKPYCHNCFRQLFG